MGTTASIVYPRNIPIPSSGNNLRNTIPSNTDRIMLGPNQLTSSWMKSDEIQVQLEKGDLVEIRRGSYSVIGLFAI